MATTESSRISMLERDTSELKDAIQSIRASNERIAESLTSLVVLETKHQETRDALNRCFGEIKEVRGDVECIKIIVPQLVESRGWVIKGMIGICTIFGIAVASLVVVK